MAALVILAFVWVPATAISAPGTGQLEVGLEIEHWLVDDGSTEVQVHLPVVGIEEAALSIDGQVVGNGKALYGRFLIDAMSLENGDHRIELWAMDEDGREGWAEAQIRVENPSVALLGFDVTTTVWPRGLFELSLETSGEVERVVVDLGPLLGEESYEVEAEQQAEHGYRVDFPMPGSELGDEGVHRVPVRVVGTDGGAYVYEGIEVFVAQVPPMPLFSEQAIFSRHTLPAGSDTETSARILAVEPEVVVVTGGEPTELLVTVEGDPEGAALLLSVADASGHLVVPLAGLEIVAEEGDPENGEGLTTYAVALNEWHHNHAAKTAGGQHVVSLALQDMAGRLSWHVSPVLLALLQPVPEYSVRGSVKHQYTKSSGVTATGALGGARLRVLNSAGTAITTGWVDWRGNYNIVVPQPTAQSSPYSLELITQEPNAKVLTATTGLPHSYSHPTTFTPAAYSPYQLDINVPLAEAGAFHIYSVLRRANAWYSAHAMPLGTTTIHWSKGVDAGCGGGSCFSPFNYDIYIEGLASNPDEFDDAIIAHEIGHRATYLHSRDDSPGGVHGPGGQFIATLAWSEGIATYLGQTVIQDPCYVDRSSIGTYKSCVDDMTGIPTGTHDGSESGKLSEGVVVSFLWDLQDPVSTAESDNLSGMESSTLAVFRAMNKVSNLDRGISGKADLADFVKLAGCSLDPTTKNHMNTLLSNRFGLDWLTATGFCN